jgi:ubiquinone/menaquinone biosynthesis C-methylase UbiE
MTCSNRRARWAALLEELAAPVLGAEEYTGQESPISANEVREMARHAGVTVRSAVADLCCGTGGPGVLLASETGCFVIGVDADAAAIEVAAERAERSGCAERTAFVVGDVLRVPLARTFDTVVLLETMLAVADKRALLREVWRLLPLGGHFALTLEAGAPLSSVEQRALPNDERVWFIEEADFRELLAESGFRVTWTRDLTAGHASRTRGLVHTFERGRAAICAGMGETFWRTIVAQHRAFASWLEGGRLRKVAIVAERAN